MNEPKTLDHMQRRRFLQALGVGGVAAAGGVVALSQRRLNDTSAGGVPPTTSPADSTTEAVPASPSTTAPGSVPTTSEGGLTGISGVGAASGRVLVVVEMNGGNDALNTLVADHGVYYDARPNLAIAASDLIELEGLGSHGLHPALAPLSGLWDAGNLAAVAGVGFQDSSRSHFEAMDWWRAGSPAASSAGWLGRWRETAQAGLDNPLAAVSLGGRNQALAGDVTNATSVVSPGAFALRVPQGASGDIFDAGLNALAAVDTDPDTAWLAAAHTAGVEARDAVELFASFSDAGGATADTGGSGRGRGRGGQDNTVTSLMSTAATLVRAELGTRVISVQVRGYDTHANQLTTHAGLLADMAGGVAAFLAEMEADGRSDDVLVMTTSEFGRRVRENGSAGTDHGRAGVQFLAGAPVRGGLVGQHGLDDLLDGDLNPSIDVRSIYQDVLDWLDGEPGATSTEVLDGGYERLDLVHT